MMGATFEGELQRSAELYEQIAEETGSFFALYFLYDSQYNREHIKRILDIMQQRRLGMTPPAQAVDTQTSQNEASPVRSGSMKTITVCQPHAHLIVVGDKRVENRTWPTKHRGPLLIHAGKSRKYLNGEDDAEMVFGAIIACARLVDCVHITAIQNGDYASEYPWLADHRYASGPWCWILSNVEPLSEPIPMRGALGLWNAEAVVDATNLEVSR